MADIDDSSLLGDILAASSRPQPERSGAPAPRARLEFEDLLRLEQPGWAAFIAAAAPDDLVVACAAGSPTWRERVLSCLDQESAAWLRSNVAALDEVGPALRQEARDRLLATAKSLQRDGSLTLPAPLADAAAAPAPAPASAAPAGRSAPAKRATAAAPPVVSIAFDAAPPAAAATASAPAHPRPAPTASAGDTRLDGLFDDLARLRDQSGVAALAPLADEVSDAFLRSGLALVARGLPTPELERALDSELAKHAEAYLNQLMGMRIRLVALAKGS